MSQVAAHGGRGMVGNASNPGFGGMGYPVGRAGGVQQQQCVFAQPPPERQYCLPAAFSAIDGRNYHTLAHGAYGQSAVRSNRF